MSGHELNLEELTEIGSQRANRLRAEGYQTISDIRDATVEELAGVSGISPRIAEQIRREAGGRDEVPDRPVAPPMDADALLEFDNEPGELEDERLKPLREPHLTLSAVGEQQRPELEVSETDVANQWRVGFGEDFIIGQPGDDRAQVEPPARDAPVEHEFEAYLPAESGVTYHPKFASRQQHRQLRWRKGQLVTPERVFGADDRQVFYPNGYPWRCVGKIFAWTNPSGSPAWAGSGALVGEKIVVTASHVVPWDADPWMMRFEPAHWDGSSVYGSGVFSYVQSVRGYRNHQQGDDMAVLKLYDSVGSSLGYFGYKTYHDSWEGGDYWTKVGYPSAVAGGSRPSRITWYPIIDDDNDGAGVELEYKADSSDGGSGGRFSAGGPAPRTSSGRIPAGKRSTASRGARRPITSPRGAAPCRASSAGPAPTGNHPRVGHPPSRLVARDPTRGFRISRTRHAGCSPAGGLSPGHWGCSNVSL